MIINGVPVQMNKTGGVADRAWFRIIMYVLMSIIGIILIIPFVSMIMKTFFTAADVDAGIFQFFPTEIQWQNYKAFFNREFTTEWNSSLKGLEFSFGEALTNTLIVAVFNLVAVPLSATFVAYGFARCEFVGKKALFAFMLSTMMLPAVVTQLPLYGFYNKINWLDTLYPLTIPNITGGGAMYIFLARSFIQSLPREIDNAAKIDGAGALRRYFSITLPLCKPIIIYIMVGIFNTAWGDFYTPLVWSTNPNEAPATLALAIYNNLTYLTDIYMVMIKMVAGVVLSIVPTVLFFVFQKQLVEGVAMDGLKG